jgi:glycosyltransferase involved in cell wall biosynthesis
VILPATHQSLVVIESHPVQYRSPVYRALQEEYGIPVTVIYASDFSIVGYADLEFRTTFAWDADLLAGYHSIFLSKVADGGARSFGEISPRGLARALGMAGDGPVLLCGYSPHFHRVALLHARRSGRAILFRAETTDHAERRSSFKASVRDLLLRRLYASCSRLLYVGHHSEDHFRRLGVPQEKLVFSPYCVSNICFRSDEAGRAQLRELGRRDLSAGTGEVVLLFSGKLSHRKGVDLLVAAVKRLPSTVRSRTILAFLGNGELRADLQAQANSLRLHFCGFKNQTQLSPYYHAADLLVLPSRHSETWGLVVNEALHHGLPCVVSRAVGCAPDLIEPGLTGEIAETDSVESLAAAILRAQQLVGRSEIRDACRERVGGYTVEKAAEGIAEACRAVH